ncbi:major facilitator superfamily domain-containing protein [Xylogone sp. PMI_703]|nr:major facilitator superfamily domain-containing protein [Xylogone sp. PMI_703]
MVQRRSRGPPRLPVQQLAILAICRFAEPVALTSVYPYLPEMIESFGISKKEVAKWAGITSAVFSLSQCVTAIFWGRASDIFGRKPTILVALTCTMICSIFWGMSISLPMAIIARSFAGACNGNVGIIRTMVAEMVPEKELQPRAFSVMPLVWSLGSILGPSFGGFFAKPAENIPGLFGKSKFLKKFPFVLPNLVTSAFFLVGLTVGVLFLKETLETKRHKTDYGLVLGRKLVSFLKRLFKREPKKFRRNSSVDESVAFLRPGSSMSNLSKVTSHDTNDVESATKSTHVLPQPTMAEVFTYQSVINLTAYFFLAMYSAAYDQLLPIFMHHPREHHTPENTHLPFKFSGGFGLASGRIGSLFTLYGAIGCVIQFLVFPPVARKYGVLNCFKVCAIAFPVIFTITPYTALIESSGLQQVVMFGIMIIKCFAGIFAFPCSIILLTNSATSLRILGTLNGFAVSISAVGRAMGPAVTGLAFTKGLEHGYVIAPWWLLTVISAVGAIPVWFLVEMEGFSKASESDEDEDEDELPPIDEDVSPTEILDGDERIPYAADEEVLDVVDGPPLDAKYSQSYDGKPTFHPPRAERRMSSPIGLRGGSVGPGGGRRLSNGLAASNYGQGTGGTSFQ